MGDIIKTVQSLRERMAEKKDLLYLMVINGQREWKSIYQAGVAYDSGWVRVEIGGYVIEGGKERPITTEERALIAEIADEHSANK